MGVFVDMHAEQMIGSFGICFRSCCAKVVANRMSGMTTSDKTRPISALCCCIWARAATPDSAS